MKNIARRIRSTLAIVAAVALTAGSLARPAAAEQGELRIAKQYGLGYLTLMVMEDQKLLEKAAKDAGMPDLKVTWATFRSSDVMNDAGIFVGFTMGHGRPRSPPAAGPPGV